MKKRIIPLMLGMFMVVELLMPLSTVEAATAATVTIKNNKNGTITYKYKNPDAVKTKVLVIKGDTQYQYELKKGNNTVRIPLTEGNGTYKLMLCKNIAGTQYAVVDQKTVTLKLTPTRMAFRPTHIIISFKASNAVIKKAKALTKKCRTKEEKIKAIWSYIYKTYKYDYAKQKKLSSLTKQYIPNINTTYSTKKGICYDISAVFASMLRSNGIETKLVTGYSKKVSGYHAWNKVYNSEIKKWYIIDCTYDLCMYRAKKSVSMKKKAKDYNTEIYQY